MILASNVLLIIVITFEWKRSPNDKLFKTKNNFNSAAGGVHCEIILLKLYFVHNLISWYCDLFRERPSSDFE